MCTALTLTSKDHYFGRNLDLEYSYHETVTITPRHYPLHFRHASSIQHHHAMIGVAFVIDEYPLYYDAVNECGLAMAGLNFPNNAQYYDAVPDKENIAPFEFIPWILGQCTTVKDVRKLLAQTNLIHLPFSKQLPLAPLHWIVADLTEAITVEAVACGMKFYDNAPGVLTNNPPFDFMQYYLANFRNLSAEPSVNRFSSQIELPTYSQGMGGIGLPGDFSSTSRFVKAAFVKLNSVCKDSEAESVNQFFHLLSAVEMPRGCVHLENGLYDITVYSSCCNQDKGIYYYTTYDNRRITAVDMHHEDLDSTHLVSYPLRTSADILFQN